ncbi:hypothetical protein [Raineyella fluvialis]|uniref:Bifunctional DNA primase/polymerase, N-terminal n=1 Tax=Raineyella fluvialis TaxID=2662261 RepID=A0A5Q2FDT8_9ACTN|nr:hypothetical protein [Raineyella fluvialis]QGF22436.1 hypothetical protein Rai3103_00630 [Raineyella fluvialis]
MMISDDGAAPIGTGADAAAGIENHHNHSYQEGCLPAFGRLLEVLGIAPDERVSVCYRRPDGALTATLGTAGDAQARADAQAGRADVWFGVNPISASAELAPGQRGRAADVARIAALYVDLDSKALPGGLGSEEGCRELLADICGLLGGRQPAAVVRSGTGGLHPYWLLEAYTPGDHERAVRLLRRFGVMVRSVAMARGGNVDFVSEPARVLRVPGTANLKPGGGPVMAEFIEDDNPDVVVDRLTLDELEVLLEASGVREEPTGAGGAGTGEVVSMADWPEGTTCAYAAAMISGWPTDSPGEGVQRRQWCLAQAVRLFEAVRLGCLSRDDLASATTVLGDRFTALHQAAGLMPDPGEFHGIIAWAQTHVEQMTEEYVRADFQHRHLDGTAQGGNAPASSQTRGGGGNTGRLSVAAMLVDLAQARYSFGCTPDGEPFAVKGSGHVVRMLRGGHKSLRSELANEYRKVSRKVASQSSLTDALTTIEGLAQEATSTSLALRLHEHEGAVWIDMGDVKDHVIRIAEGGWEVRDKAPVLFRRTELTGAFPMPVPGGSIECLWKILNVAEADRVLVLGWLVAALLAPQVPHAILALFGEQGTGKSVATKFLVRLVDPSPVELRRPPRDEAVWPTTASGSWVVALDNLSAIPPWLSDTLCRAATGDADVQRQLYTNGGLVVFKYLRALILNGIALDGVRGDLADRMVAIDLDVIPAQARMTEVALAALWDSVYPSLVGALLDLAAKVHQALPSITLAEAPRMADFAMVLAALDQLNGTDGLGRFLDRSSSMAADSLDDNPFIARMMDQVVTPFDGTARQLLDLVTHGPDGTMTIAPTAPQRGWPGNPRAVTNLLVRNRPALLGAGWTVEDLGNDNKDKTKRWHIVPPTSGAGGSSGAGGGSAMKR